MKPSWIEIFPTYKKDDSGLWSLDTEQLPLPKDFKVKEKSIIYFPPKQSGGNHIHPRTEIFLGIGASLKLVWQDKDGHTHSNPMNPENKLYLFRIPPHLPHAVVNESDHQFAMLLELADQKQENVKAAALI